MRRQDAHRGLTLVELLIAMGLMVIVSGAISYGFVAGLDMQRAQTRRQEAQSQVEGVERRLVSLLENAVLTNDAQIDATTYFVGAATGGESGLGCDSLVFTTTAPALPMVALQSEDDFETQQSAFGPQGGIAEISLSMTPFAAPGNQTGLFERIQRPSDGDPTQGGEESLLSPDVDSIGFQFWNGLQWVNTWDTQLERRLPAAVKINYTLRNQDTVRTLLVPIPQSDVDSQNPSTLNGT